MAIGLLIVIFLWFRPQGVPPERRRMIGAGASSQPMNIPNEDVVALDGVGRAPGRADAPARRVPAGRATANLAPKAAAGLLSEHVRTLAEAGAAVLIVEQRARAVLAISDYTYVLGGGQVLMADTPARLAASQEFTESFFGVVPQSPKG